MYEDISDSKFISMAQQAEMKINVDGPNSKFLQNATGANFRLGGYQNYEINVTNGGEFASSENNWAGSFQNTPGKLATYIVDGEGSQMTFNAFTLGGRSRLDQRGSSVMYVRNNGLLYAGGYNDSSVTVQENSALHLDNGTVYAPSHFGVELRNNTIGDDRHATLTGTGTIQGNLRASGESLIQPGVGGAGAAGTLRIESGGLFADGPTDVQGAAIIEIEFSTESGNPHDRIEVVTAGQSAQVGGVFTYSVLPGGTLSNAAGIFDFLVADTIVYSGADGAFSSGDLPADVDNLDGLLALAGYVRVIDGPPIDANQYRYYIANDVLPDAEGNLTLDALRLEFVPIPEPTVLSLLAAGGLLMLRRRRA